jgi:hypothetical protein
MLVKQQKLRSGAGDKPISQRSHRHPAEIGRDIKAESRSGMTTQPPKVAASTQQRSEKAQRLKVGVEQQANLPKQGRGGSQSQSLGQRAAFKTELPFLAMGGADQRELQRKGITAAAW